ncbi:HORMA domain-containing protein 1-like isoform X3 [Mauremys mutica]|uniref:HORMA domain-containing protein 1-like isoform X3 n=1 Tax=Mauremys mutica TaxID=74926 RepID=UPI001D16CB08|nr:HORMA domain-containing protein 1-like isoform X3 [Mauremys mutica]
MATIQKFRTARKQDTCGWATLFPREIKTHQQSLVMVKRIMAVAVSGITYLRGIFPEDAYSTHYLEVTPPEYQPPGFKEVESEFILFEGIPVHVKVGEIETSFHTLKLKILKREERIDSMDIHGILKECREDAEREKEQRRDTLGEYINTEYEPPGSEEEFVDKYHKVNDEATRKRKISKKKKKNK